MPTTSNFGWTTPADTDLVKDGALAIRTLGNGIDTSMAQLKGGTAGQVLSKTNGTDMAFTWVTQDDANAIQNAIVDAKGDLIAATANDTPARLAVGNNGETLVADSSASVGLRYQEPKAGNPVINSAFQVWQRGTTGATVTSGGVPNYQADRWFILLASSGSISSSRQATNDTTNLPNIQYCARVQRTAGNTSTAAIFLQQPFESVNSVPFAGKTVTVSFYARAGANYSGGSSNLPFQLITGTGTDQNQVGGYTGQAVPISQSATLTTTWQRFAYSGTLATNTNELSLAFFYTPSGTAGAADYFEITGVQLEVGSVATPFKTQGVTLAGELGACQRYYFRTNANTSFANMTPSGLVTTSTNCYSTIQCPVPLRSSATVLEFSTLQVLDSQLSTFSVTAAALSQSTNQVIGIDFTISGATANRFAWVRANNSLSAYIGIGAEL